MRVCAATWCSPRVIVVRINSLDGFSIIDATSPLGTVTLSPLSKALEGTSDLFVNSRLGPEMHRFCVAFLANRTTIGGELRLESGHLRLRSVLSRINQRFFKAFVVTRQ
jgi:hypothetical protein